MIDSITMTTKGTFTLPARIRKDLGLNSKGDRLAYSYDAVAKRLTINRPVDFNELQAKMSTYIKPDTKPLTDVSEYYHTHRQK